MQYNGARPSMPRQRLAPAQRTTIATAPGIRDRRSPRSSPDLVESAHLTQVCDGLAVVADSLAVDRGSHPDDGVLSLAVMGDLQKSGPGITENSWRSQSVPPTNTIHMREDSHGFVGEVLAQSILHLAIFGA